MKLALHSNKFDQISLISSRAPAGTRRNYRCTACGAYAHVGRQAFCGVILLEVQSVWFDNLVIHEQNFTSPSRVPIRTIYFRTLRSNWLNTLSNGTGGCRTPPDPTVGEVGPYKPQKRLFK